MSLRSVQLRLSPEQQASHDRNLAEASEQVLTLARLLYAAAFPDRPRLGDFDPIAPLYLEQATTLRRDALLRADLHAAIERMFSR